MSTSKCLAARRVGPIGRFANKIGATQLFRSEAPAHHKGPLIRSPGDAQRLDKFSRMIMFGSKPRGTVIAKGLKIVGSVTAEGLVEVDGQIDGELHCTSLVAARGAHVMVPLPPSGSW